MNTSFYNGVTGMKTSQIGIDVLGDNIANINTIGYKEQNVSFANLFSTSLTTALNSPVTSDIGYSATAVSSTMDLSQGSIVQTDNTFDLSLSGQGWMPIKDINGELFYTRTGSFTKDANGELVTQNGDKLQVVNANNLVQDENGEWKFDATIPTDNLITDEPTLSPIKLPDNILFPAEATQNVKLAGNLPNQAIAPDPKPAIADNQFGVLYDRNGEVLNMQDGNDVVFGFGDNIFYKDGLIRYDACVLNDVKDGKDVNINFDVNGKNIKMTLPDGSTSKEIIDAITQELDKNGILYSRTDNSFEIRDANKLDIKSNGGDIITQNASLHRLVYNAYDNSGDNFTTLNDFMSDIQKMADFVYPGMASVNLDDKGQIFISNNTDNKEILALMYDTDNSNDMFIQNLGHLGSNIKPNTASNSLAFTRNYQGFSGNIIDSEGNVNTLKFDFYKTKVEGDNTIWTLDLSELDPDGNVISSVTQDLTFDNIGGLILPNPPTIKIDNNGTETTIDLGGNFNGITSTDKDNVGFMYSQDGLVNGYLEKYDVNDLGEIVATFSNGRMGVLGQIPIYHFINEQGLDSVGGNKYTPTDNSGDAYLFNDGNGYITGAKVMSNSLEASNVNMAQAMSELIVIQKAFEANSKSITTSDQMVQKAIEMKR